MPPFTPNKSKAQQRKMFALEEKGELAKGEAEGKARATNYKSLPDHVKSAALKGLHHGLGPK